ncbi:MAG: gliding motility-associated C-terminal domain-containing protein, partial [Parvicellaceae bacterium]
ILVIDTTFQDSVSCNGLLDGYAAIGNISGGNGGLTYSWDATAGSQTTDTATNLAAGTYTVTITDAKGCSKDTTVSVLQPDSLLIIVTSQDSVSCSGLADGSASVDSISGGNGNYSYLWDATANNQTTTLASNLAIGTYRVLVSDMNNCIDSADVTVFEPNALTIYTSNDSVSCNGLSDGSAIVDSVIGGNGVYFYLWDATANNQITDTASSLIAGTYLVTVTDQNGCSLDSSVIVSQPDSLIIDTLSVLNPYCSSSNDGSITLNINGGTQPISSNWTNILGTYSSTDQDIDSLFVGSYIINVSDYNGCNSTDTITLTPNVEIIVNAGNDTLVCFGDSLTLFGASTGTTNPTLSWDIFNPITSTDSTISTGSSQVNISSFTQDSAQIYSFIYTVEEQSCTVKDSVLVTVVSLPIVDAGLDVTLGYNDPHILGGNPTGPSGASYSWTPITNFTFESDSILENPGIDVLSSVTYTVFVTDTNGCISSDQVVVSLIPNIIVPSGFSPNGDGINDTWEIQNLEAFENTTVRVYNRWGTLVYDYDESNENWTGGGSSNEMIPVGTYYFIIEFDNYDGERGNITGPITIIR